MSVGAYRADYKMQQRPHLQVLSSFSHGCNIVPVIILHVPLHQQYCVVREQHLAITDTCASTDYACAFPDTPSAFAPGRVPLDATHVTAVHWTEVRTAVCTAVTRNLCWGDHFRLLEQGPLAMTAPMHDGHVLPCSVASK